ncbi:MAG: SapC family protein [Halorhodospira sp.]
MGDMLVIEGFYDQLTPVGSNRHQRAGFRAPKGFSFACSAQQLPIAGSELMRAAATLPLVFRAHRDRTWSVRALTSLIPEHNHYVLQRSGRLRAAFTPLALQTYPFAKVYDKRREASVLCIDEPALVGADEEEAQPLFEGEGGQVSSAVRRKARLIERLEREQKQLSKAAAVLAEAQLLEPWPMEVRIGSEQTHTLRGLYRIRAEALREISDGEKLTHLQSEGALELAYAQRVSQQQMRKLKHWADQWRYHENRQKRLIEDSLPVSNDEEIQFDWGQLDLGGDDEHEANRNPKE